ncbi:MAG: hypothetical protein DRI46_06770 [Chloroflexi bacterium]|nr:MAG: hypothetical protein DRI46_06770 [Chloroflexota bacterium]
MKLKKGVVIAGLNLRMRPVLKACEAVMNDMRVDFVITAGLEGLHSAGSLHYYGLAIDVRTRDLRIKSRKIAAARIQNILGGDYDVVLEKDHIHVEYDPPGDIYDLAA